MTFTTSTKTCFNVLKLKWPVTILLFANNKLDFELMPPHINLALKAQKI